MKQRLALLMAFILIALTIVPLSAMAAAGASGTGEIKATVSLRTGPSTSYRVLKYLKAGENVAILDEVNNYWYKVQDRLGQVGYISSLSKYIEIKTAGNAVVVSSVSLRKAPSTDAARIRYLSKGESVLVVGQPSKYWFEVQDSQGVRGYVSSSPQYIQTGAGQFTSTGGTGGSSSGSGVEVGSGTQSAVIERVIAAGMKYWGTPYEFSSDRSTTTTFDCSDFVRTAFLEGAGITLPSDSRKQGAYVKQKGGVLTDWHQLKRGDLMFFMSYKGSNESSYAGVDKAAQTITHVGIYLGNGQILHTYSKESGGVRTSNIAGTHWEYRFLFGGSAL